MLVVVPGLLGEAGGGQHDVGLAARGVEQGVERRSRCGRRRWPARRGRDRGSRPEDRRRAGPARRCDRRRRPGGCPRCRGRRSAGVDGHAPANQSRPVVEGDPTREQPGGEAHVEGAVHVGPTQRREEQGVGPGGDHGGGGVDDAVGRLGDRAAAQHDGERARSSGRRAGGPGSRRRRPPRRRRVSVSVVATRARTSSPASPGRGCSEAVGERAEARCCGATTSTMVTPSFTAAWRRRRNRTGSSSFGSGPSSSTVPPGAQTWSMVARGRPSTTSAGRPSPSWASTLSVPSTPLASLAQA